LTDPVTDPSTDSAADGPPRARRETTRGAQRRAALLDAARDLLEEEGFGAVTHRAVAARAQLPLAATTYYFASREDLLGQAMRSLGASYLRTAHEVVARQRRRPAGARAIASAVVEIVAGPDTDDPSALLTFYERYIQAGRHPDLRPIVAELTRDLEGLVGVVLERACYDADDDLPHLLVALVDGLLVGELAQGGADPRRAARRGVARLLSGGVRPASR